jgi:tetratricopeptide (TPR) repeat protein
MFQRATTIDQGDAQAEANLAYVLLALKRFPEAEEAARSSVRADSLSSQARYLLAVSLIEQRKLPKEVMFHLSKAKDQFEPARKLWLRLVDK